jgi:hypothetical protein
MSSQELTYFKLIIFSLSHNLSSQESFQYYSPVYVSLFPVVPFHQEFQPKFCLNLTHPRLLHVSLFYYLVWHSLWEPSCLSLLLYGTDFAEQGDIPVTGVALNLCSGGYPFKSGSKTGYLGRHFLLSSSVSPRKLQDKILHNRFFRIPSN